MTGVVFHQSFTGYFLGLLWVSLHATMNFFRLAYLAARGSSRSAAETAR